MATKFDVVATTKSSHETLVVFTSYKNSGKKKELTIKGASKSVLEKAKSCFEDGFKSEAGEQLALREQNLDGYKNILFIGLGDATKLSTEGVRRAAGSLTRDLSVKSKTVTALAENILSLGRDKAEVVQAFCEGAVLGAYKFDELKGKYKKEDKPQPNTKLELLCKNKTEESAVKKSLERGVVLGETINFARFLGDMPGNLMTPTELGKQTQAQAKGTSLKVQVWDKARCQKENFGNFLGVAKGSDEPCKFIVMEYKGAGAKAKPVCFVGKGLTFDCGGISIKPSPSMEEMKYDMCGGAAVIATMVALAKLKAKVNAIAYVPATENLVNGLANKPGDITTARNGKTTEVNNTDAEGRLILSDALCYASEHKPAFIVDAATLTGAMVISLGDTHTGFFCTDNKLRKHIFEAAEKSGEVVWEMPLSKEHSEDMKGTYADLSNISYNKGAGSAKGAAYLKEFVGEDIPWAHFDIAGTAWGTGSRIPYNPRKGASGVMIRTFVKLAERWK